MIGRKPSIASPHHGALLPVSALTALLMPRSFSGRVHPFWDNDHHTQYYERSIKMGIGSYGICNDKQKAVCIDCLGFNDWQYEDVEENIISCLPPSFAKTDGWENDHRIIAENRLHSVQITGHAHDIGLRIRVKSDLQDYIPDTTGLAQANLSRVANGIFDRLSRFYKLRVKTSGYTSTPWVRRENS